VWGTGLIREDVSLLQTGCYFVCAVLGAGLAVSAGCQRDPFAIDDRLERLITNRSDSLGGRPVLPTLSKERLAGVTAASRSTRPATLNPAAEELTFVAADEQRDVESRLEGYAAQAGAIVVEGDSGLPTLTLKESFQASQITGREYLSAEEEYLFVAIRLLQERHLWGPRFFNETTATIRGSGERGDFSHALDVINRLRVSQRLPYGGTVEAEALVSATDQLREEVTGSYVQSSRLALRADIPLLRGAGSVAREDLIQAERDMVYAARDFERFRRSYFVDIASVYFDLLQIKARIGNQQRQLASLVALQRQTLAQVEAGRREAFERDNAENRVRQAQSDLAQLRESYILALDRFKIRLGLATGLAFDLSNDLIDPPEPETTLEEATRLALEYRLDLQNVRDRVEDTRRAVANAENDLLPDLNVGASVGIPTDPADLTGGLSIDPDETEYSASATLGLPLDREVERLNRRAAIVRLQRATRLYEQTRDEIAISVRAALRAVENARLQLSLAEEQVRINLKRKRGLELKRDTVDTQSFIDADNDLLNAENQRDRARTQLRNAVLQYLLESDQLRVKADGSFQPLPGM